MIHCMEVKRSWTRLRLVPTAFIGLLTLVHFHLVIWVFHPYSLASSLDNATKIEITGRAQSPSVYPLPNYVPCLVESFLLFSTLVTISLNAITQILTTGHVSQPIFGVGSGDHGGGRVRGGMRGVGRRPRWDEDWTVVLFRLGTESLEATSLVGLGYEVGAVGIGLRLGRGRETLMRGRAWMTDLGLWDGDEDKMDNAPGDDEGIVELDRSGVVSLRSQPRGTRPKAGFENEIKRVRPSKVGSGSRFWVESVFDFTWRKELVKFSKTVMFFWLGIWGFISGKRRTRDTPAEERNEGPSGPVEQEKEEADVDEHLYQRFLREEVWADEEDDEDQDFDPDSVYFDDDISDIVSDDEHPVEGEDGLVNKVEDETMDLYADLSTSVAHPAASSSSPSRTSISAPVLLAHLTHTFSSPLTRRRYSQLVVARRPHSSSQLGDDFGEDNEWEEFIRERRELKLRNHVSGPKDEDEKGARACVICTVEPREIICWPCR